MIGGDDNGNGRGPMPLQALAGTNPYEGIPYRGDQIHIKHDDPQHKQPQVVYDMHVKTFDLGDPKQLKEYEDIMQSIASGKAIMSMEQVIYCKDIKGWRVLIRWGDQFLEAPKEDPGARTAW